MKPPFDAVRRSAPFALGFGGARRASTRASISGQQTQPVTVHAEANFRLSCYRNLVSHGSFGRLLACSLLNLIGVSPAGLRKSPAQAEDICVRSRPALLLAQFRMGTLVRRSLHRRHRWRWRRVMRDGRSGSGCHHDGGRPVRVRPTLGFTSTCRPALVALNPHLLLHPANTRPRSTCCQFRHWFAGLVRQPKLRKLGAKLRPVDPPSGRTPQHVRVVVIEPPEQRPMDRITLNHIQDLADGGVTCLLHPGILRRRGREYEGPSKKQLAAKRTGRDPGEITK